VTAPHVRTPPLNAEQLGLLIGGATKVRHNFKHREFSMNVWLQGREHLREHLYDLSNTGVTTILVAFHKQASCHASVVQSSWGLFMQVFFTARATINSNSIHYVSNWA
jgi:hypothetical protein